MTGPDLPAATPAPAPVPGPVPGAPRSDSPVTRAIASLDGLAERPLAEHPDVYQQVHEALQGALADIDDA
ncbi:MAG: hypothetical protein ACHQCG_02560 [Solirubrobacterales bacterium]